MKNSVIKQYKWLIYALIILLTMTLFVTYIKTNNSVYANVKNIKTTQNKKNVWHNGIPKKLRNKIYYETKDPKNTTKDFGYISFKTKNCVLGNMGKGVGNDIPQYKTLYKQVGKKYFFKLYSKPNGLTKLTISFVKNNIKASGFKMLYPSKVKVNTLHKILGLN